MDQKDNEAEEDRFNGPALGLRPDGSIVPVNGESGEDQQRVVTGYDVGSDPVRIHVSGDGTISLVKDMLTGHYVRPVDAPEPPEGVTTTATGPDDNVVYVKVECPDCARLRAENGRLRRVFCEVHDDDKDIAAAPCPCCGAVELRRLQEQVGELGNELGRHGQWIARLREIIKACWPYVRAEKTALCDMKWGASVEASEARARLTKTVDDVLTEIEKEVGDDK